MEEFSLVNSASALFEAASGCRLHRDPASQKCKFLPLGRWRRTLQQEDLPRSCQYMMLSDHLDMVGVQLRTTWTQTRKANFDMVQERVSSTVNSWKAGKFMPLSLRPWSINSYVLSKIWFKCGSVDLRVADTTAINSSVKSWLYADLWEKPSESVMCRPASYGGLGVASVKHKGQAVLIKTFLETAASPKFRHSLLHSIMFRFHILDDTSVPDLGYLPYYPASFFQLIKHVHLETPLNILTMSISQWTRMLTEDGLTMMEDNNVRKYIPCRSELSSPTTDWEQSWRLCRQAGLGSDLDSFNFKLLHGLLVTKQRINHLTPGTPATCSHCQVCVQGDLQHALLHCSYNDGAGQALLSAVQEHLPETSILMAIWDKRLSKQRITLYEIRATLEARCLLLRETRFSNHHAKLLELKNLL